MKAAIGFEVLKAHETDEDAVYDTVTPRVRHLAALVFQYALGAEVHSYCGVFTKTYVLIIGPPGSAASECEKCASLAALDVTDLD